MYVAVYVFSREGEQGNGRAAPAGGLAVGLQSMADVVASKLAAETREVS